tara:strand:+ start:1227 stop:1406 length:180 start_codon:yes stop_codon:yes gene_type:complete
MNDCSERWVAVVYDHGDKIDSRTFYGTTEDIVQPAATEWVESNYGEKKDWSFHHVVSDK